MTEYNWILGLGLMFGLALIFNRITFESLSGFLIFLTFFNGFAVIGNLLPLWSLILNLVVLCFIMYFEINQKRSLI